MRFPGSNTSSNKALPWVLAVVVLLTGAASTWLIWHDMRRQEEQALRSAFNSQASQTVSAIRNQLALYQVVMHSIQGFFLGSDTVSYDEFLRYVRSLDPETSLQGVQAVAYAMPVRQDELALHEAAMAAQLPVPYQVYPQTDEPLLAPIVFIEPLADNLLAIGYNTFATPQARAAMELARDSGELVISEPLLLVQDTGFTDITSFVMYLPVYDPEIPLVDAQARAEAIRGWVDIPFRMLDFMQAMQASLHPAIDIQIRDLGLPDEQGLLYDSNLSGMTNRSYQRLQIREQFQFGEREWQITLGNTPAYNAEVQYSSNARLTLFTGSSLSLMLALLVLVIARSRAYSEERAQRLSRLYRALSEVNQAIVRMDREDQLFSLVCRIAVEFGGMEMAWVGQLDNSNGQIRPVASHGKQLSYLDGLSISIRIDTPEGLGPAGTALREGRPVIINNYQTDPATTPWHERARQFGWHAMASFPLLRRQKPFAVLNVYHSKLDTFDADATALLLEMCSDISFALDNFDREKKRRESELALAESEARLSTIMDNVGACIYLKDPEGRYLYANQQVLDLWGVKRSEVIGAGDERFFDAETVNTIRHNDLQVFELGKTLEVEENNVDLKSGRNKTFWSVKLPLRQTDGKIYALCGISTDITERKAREQEIYFLSNHDPLTGLPNQRMFRNFAEKALQEARRKIRPLTLFYLDIDRFKLINDSLGPSVGDELLKAFARRLNENMAAEDSLYRQGGDEFILLIPDKDTSAISHMAETVLELASRPFIIGEKRLAVTVSIGIASYPGDAGNLEHLMQAADTALFRAKHKGRGNFQFFTHEMQHQASEMLHIENELREALAQNQLSLHYQPLADIHLQSIHGIEALIRWNHPLLGQIPPDRFIPLAEESGLILEIGNWVMTTALQQLASWRAEGLQVVPVAINLSAMQFFQPDFFSKVRELLQETGLPPELLELELTERVAMEDSRMTLERLNHLHRLGVNLSIDDFGTGYSSLSYLKKYPIQKIKIDKSFTHGLPHDSEDVAIVSAIIGMAKGLGFMTLAEGVETAEQLQFLQANGCDEMQGYLYSKAVSADEIRELLKNSRVRRQH